MIYVASPYYHPEAKVREHRAKLVTNFVYHALKEKYVVFSPIMYLHDLAVARDLPKDAEFWKGFNVSMIRRAEGMFVLRMIGWETSRGVQHEISLAREINLPITWVDFSNEAFPEGCSI